MGHKIIVESFNDQAIYSHIFSKYCLSTMEIEPIEANHLDWLDLDGLEQGKLVLKLKDIKTDILKSPIKSKIGIIIDLDNQNIQQRISFLNQACSEAFGLDINISHCNKFSSFIFSDEEIDFELGYCFSGLNGSGELEHLLKEIADTAQAYHANCLTQGWIACLEQKGIKVKEKELRKLWMDFYKRLDCLSNKQQRQAKQNVRWDNFLKLHPDKFDFSRDIEELNQLKVFLKYFVHEPTK